MGRTSRAKVLSVQLKGNKDSRVNWEIGTIAEGCRRTAGLLGLAIPDEKVDGEAFMALDYPLELGGVDGVVCIKRISFVSDDEVEVRLNGSLGRGRGRSDTEDVEGSRRDL